MTKKGFIFIETLVVLCVLTVSLIGIYGLFSKVLNDYKERINYDNINDLYKVNIIRDLVINLPSENYALISDSCLNSSTCTTSCTDYLSSECSTIIEDLNIDKIMIINTVLKDDFINLMNMTDLDIPNTMKNYMKTIYDKQSKHIIVSFLRSDKNYYASLMLFEETSNE